MQILRPSLAWLALSLAGLTAPVAAALPGLQEKLVRVRFVPPEQADVALDQLSFPAAKEMLEGLAEGEELVLPFPFHGLGPVAEVVGDDCRVTIDAERRAFVLTTTAEVRGVEAAVFFSATFARPVGAGDYAFGVRPGSLRLGELLPALAGTPLAHLGFDEAGIVAAGTAHAIAPLDGVREVLGAAPVGKRGIEVRGGIELFASIPSDAFPAAGRALETIGIETAELRLAGRIGGDPVLLFGAGDASSLDLALEAQLAAGSMQGLQGQLPSWVKPTGLAPSLTVRHAEGDLFLGVAFDVQVEIRGERRPFRMAAEYAASDASAELTLRGETTAAWKRPFGIEWIELETASLTVTGDGEGAEAVLSSTVQVGEKGVDFRFSFDGATVRVEAGLDQLSVGDLAAFVAERTGSPFVADLALGDAARLSNVGLVIERSDATRLEVSGTASLGGAAADVVLCATKKGSAKVEPVLVVRRHAGSLGDLLPGLAGTPADLAFPASVWTVTPPKGGLRSLSSADLGVRARELFQGVYGPGDFTLELQPGIHLGASLPMSSLPPALLQALGITNPSESLVVEGALAMTLDLGAGKPSASVQSVELHAELPATAAVASRLPAGAPQWMRPEASSKRTLTLRYEAPNQITFLKTNAVTAHLDGAERRFLLSTEIAADGQGGSVALSGSMVGEWKEPFGMRALTLRDVKLSAEGQAQTGRSGQRSGGVVLEGGFDLGPKSGTMRLELAGQSGSGLSGTFAGTLDSLSLADLTQIDLFPNMPREGLQKLGALLGQLPALQEPTLRATIGRGTASLSLGAHVDLRGVRTNLLVFVGKGPRGPQALFGVHPQGFSLAALFPALGQNPAVAPLANISLDHFGLLVAAGDQKLVPADVDEDVRAFFTRMTGEEQFEIDVVGGLTVEARFPTSSLPDDLALAVGRLTQTMGIDATSSLSLRGSLGTSLADMSLALALPPIRPANAPQWLRGGQLAIAIDGTPSVFLQAILTLDCEGDLIDLMVEGGVERQGANVAIALKSALQAEDVWESPFGLEWLEIRRFSGELSIDALANIGFGGGGDVTIGSKDIQVYAWTKINAATGVPMGLVLHGNSEAGVALRDLAVMQADIRRAAGIQGPKVLPLDQLPDIALQNLEILIATRAVPDEGIDSPGFKVTGDLYIPLRPGAKGTKFVSVHGEVSKEGIVARGSLGAYQLGPLTWQDSYVDLEATLASQHLMVHGGLDFLGAHSMTDLRISRAGVSFQVERAIAGLGSADLLVDAKLDLRNPTFLVRGELQNEFGERFGSSVLGEATDVAGKAAAIGAAAIAAVTTAEQGLEALRTELGIPTPLETLEAVAVTHRDNAKWHRDQHAQGTKLHDFWQGAYERRSVLVENIVAGKTAVENAKAERQRIQAELGNLLTRIANYPGRTVVVRSAAFEAGLAVLQEGGSIDVEVEVLFLGQPEKIAVHWNSADMAANARQVVQAVMAGPYRLVHGG